jgi:hypothetical protein
MSILQKLTEGVQNRDMQAEGQALLNKWEATGLLEGLNEGQAKQGMAVLLENQAKELLREASAMATGDVEGFAAVAFPIVRRVFGGLIANDLVSVQPMSLPSGLIFFLDFIKSGDNNDSLPGRGSVYGGNVVGRQLTGGVDLSDTPTAGDVTKGGLDAGGFYDFNTGYAHATGTVAASANGNGLSGMPGAGLAHAANGFTGNGADTLAEFQAATENGEALRKLIDFDPDLLALDSGTSILLADVAVPPNLNRDALAAVTCETLTVDGDGVVTARVINTRDSNSVDVFHADTRQVRRLTKIVEVGGVERLRLCFINPTQAIQHSSTEAYAASNGIQIVSYPIKDTFGPGGASNDVLGLGAVLATSKPLEGSPEMAEIDIKVDSIAVTAQTKKLKAKWTPELGQDLNAYHNLDAEVELTGILSEQIALEIDRELLGDLVRGATAGTRYWSRAPGLFVDSEGKEIGSVSAAPDFTGTVSEWYETLIETINDVSAQIHRKTLRGGANFVVCSPEVANILEFTSGFRASVTADQDRGTIGAVRAGSLSKKFDVYVDPYFLRNVILVGRKGGSFLESGFVYAPYVPLQVTPTIFGTEDFVPRKGVMTRYAKKMVRPDMYGLVICRGLLGESGR